LRRGARLGPLWQTVPLFNRVVYLIIRLCWTFCGAADVHIAVSTGMTHTFLVASLAVVWWVIKTGWRIRR
jgi:ABC-2 type transport system permease protein